MTRSVDRKVQVGRPRYPQSVNRAVQVGRPKTSRGSGGSTQEAACPSRSVRYFPLTRKTPAVAKSFLSGDTCAALARCFARRRARHHPLSPDAMPRVARHNAKRRPMQSRTSPDIAHPVSKGVRRGGQTPQSCVSKTGAGDRPLKVASVRQARGTDPSKLQTVWQLKVKG